MNRFARLCAVMAVCLAASGGSAEETEASGSDARARAILEESLDRIAGAKSLRFEIQTEFDVVQGSGQKLEFGDRRTVIVRRPDRFRVNVQRRPGDRVQLTFDGKDGILYSPNQKVYAKVALGSTIDEALDSLTDDLGVPFPLGGLLRADMDSSVPALFESALYVGPATLDGVACDHLAFAGADADLQIWVASAGKRLPRRIVVTYHSTEGQPQFRADFIEWSLAPDVPDSLFVFTPPPGSQPVSFAKVSGPDEGAD